VRQLEAQSDALQVCACFRPCGPCTVCESLPADEPARFLPARFRLIHFLINLIYFSHSFFCCVGFVHLLSARCPTARRASPSSTANRRRDNRRPPNEPRSSRRSWWHCR
jgi:hypothetical protein